MKGGAEVVRCSFANVVPLGLGGNFFARYVTAKIGHCLIPNAPTKGVWNAANF